MKAKWCITALSLFTYTYVSGTNDQCAKIEKKKKKRDYTIYLLA